MVEPAAAVFPRHTRGVSQSGAEQETTNKNRQTEEQHGRPGDASSGRALLQGGRFSSAGSSYIMPGEQTPGRGGAGKDAGERGAGQDAAALFPASYSPEPIERSAGRLAGFGESWGVVPAELDRFPAGMCGRRRRERGRGRFRARRWWVVVSFGERERREGRVPVAAARAKPLLRWFGSRVLIQGLWWGPRALCITFLVGGPTGNYPMKILVFNLHSVL